MTLLIKNAQFLGGADHKPDEPVRSSLSPHSVAGENMQDIFISGDTISAIGDFSDKIADEVIDGRGAYLASGFIDAHTESDHHLDLLRHPAQKDFLLQGVTTIVGGYDGVSLAPFSAGSVDLIRAWANPRGVNAHWRTVKEFLNSLNKRKLGVNFLTFVGYETLRAAMGITGVRAMAAKDTKTFSSMLDRALADGAAGLSVGSTSFASRRMPYREMKSFAGVLKKYGGIYAADLGHAPHRETYGSFEELEKLHRETGVKILAGGRAPEEGFVHAVSRKKNFRFTVPLSGISSMPVLEFLPMWARKETIEATYENIRDPWLGPKIMHDLPAVHPDGVIILTVPGHESIEGFSLHGIMRLYGIPSAKRALMKLMILTKLRARVGVKNADTEYFREAARHSASFIASENASPRLFGEKELQGAYASFPKFLSRAQKENISLDSAVRKITAEPAAFFGLERRGTIQEGNFADLVLFQMSGRETEIRAVIVNGKIAAWEGELVDAKSGRALKYQ